MPRVDKRSRRVAAACLRPRRSAAEMAFDQQHATAMAHYQNISNACRLFNTRIRSYGGLMW